MQNKNKSKKTGEKSWHKKEKKMEPKKRRMTENDSSAEPAAQS